MNNGGRNMGRILGVMLMAVSASVANATIYYWYSDADLGGSDPGYDLKTLTGKGAQGGNMAVLYKAGTARTTGTWYQDLMIYDDFSTSQGDVKVTQTTLLNDLGWIYIDKEVDIDDGGNYFTVLFNVAVGSLSAGNRFIVMDKVTQPANDPSGWGEILCFDSLKDNAGIQWNTVQQAVPEPATLSLLGAGGLGSWLMRRRQRRIVRRWGKAFEELEYHASFLEEERLAPGLR